MVQPAGQLLLDLLRLLKKLEKKLALSVRESVTCRCGLVAMETIRAQGEAVVLEELQKLDQLIRVNCVVNYIILCKCTYT